VVIEHGHAWEYIWKSWEGIDDMGYEEVDVNAGWHILMTIST